MEQLAETGFVVVQVASDLLLVEVLHFVEEFQDVRSGKRSGGRMGRGGG